MAKTKVKRPLKPRTQPDGIDIETRSGGERDKFNIPSDARNGNFYNTTVLGEHGLVVIRPKKDEAPVFFKASPRLDYEQPTELLASGRKDTGFLDPNTFCSVPSVKFLGMDAPPDVDDRDPENWDKYPKFSFATHLPGTTGDGRSRADQAKATHPYLIFFNRLSRQVYRYRNPSKENPVHPTFNGDWVAHFTGGAGRGPAISRPGFTCLIQGAVYSAKGKSYVFDPEEGVDRNTPYGFAEGDPVVIIELSNAFLGVHPSEARDRNPAKGLKALMAREKKGHDELNDDPSARFVYGDPVGTYDPKTGTVKKGVILVAYMAEQLNRLTKQDRERILKHTDWNGAKEDSFASYHAGALASYEANGVKFTPSMTKEEVDQVFAKWMFWWDDVQEPEEAPGLIHIPGADEVAEFMARGLGWHDDGKAMLEFGWADHPEFATDSVKGILNNRESVSFSETLTNEEEFTSELSETSAVVDEEKATEEWPDDEVPFEADSEVAEDEVASTDEDDDDEFPEVDLEEEAEDDDDDVFEEDDEEEDAPDPDDVASEKEDEMRNSMEAAKGRSKRRVSKRNNPPVE
jgi:hypothetical protein